MNSRSDQLERGSEIGGYRIDEIISRGGMGIVYRATNVALHKIYALKVLTPELGDDPQFRERFKREMRVAASLHHPNVVAIHYAGEHEGMLFLVMDFIYGSDMRELLIKTGALDAHRAVDLLAQFASALDAAHAKGLVHRDVKPGNMLITVHDGQEHGYLTDFGLAKRPDNVDGLTAKGAVVGTVDYMAPEQINGDPIDARTDIYALGCVFFQMLTGKVPYERENSIATLFAHVNAPPPSLPEGLSELYPTYGGVIEKAMAKEPADRYLSAGDFARDAAASLSGVRYRGPQTSVATGEATVLRSGDAASEPPSPPAEVTRAPEMPSAPSVAEPVASVESPPTSSHQPTQPPPSAVEPPPTSMHQPTQPPPAPVEPPPTSLHQPTAAPAAAASTPQPPVFETTPPQPPPAPPSGTGGPPGPPAGGQAPRPIWRRPLPVLVALLIIGGVVGGVIAISSGGSGGGSSSGSGGNRFSSNVRPVPTNRVSGIGTVTVDLNGNVATVTMNTDGLVNAPHLMHIHGGTGNCPPASAATTFNGHPFISAGIGDKFYGGVVASLTQQGDTSAQAHLESSLYPATGTIRYKRTLTLGQGIAAEIRQGLGVIVVHGIDYNGNGTYTNFLGQGAEAAAPALCGPLFPSTTASTGTNGGHGVVYTASLGVLSGSTPGSPAPLLLCHIAGTPVGAPPSSSAGSGGPPAPA
jgi:serine/threonine protein kinase